MRPTVDLSAGLLLVPLGLLPAVGGGSQATPAPTPEVKELRRFEGHQSFVHCVAFTPDGKKALSGGFDGTGILWDVRTGKQLARYRTGDVMDVAILPGGQKALWVRGPGGKRARAITLWDLAAGKDLKSWPEEVMIVHCIRLLPGGRRAVSGNGDGMARLWDLETGKEL